MDTNGNTYRIVYTERNHKSDCSVTVWALTADKALEKFHNSKYHLNKKPLPEPEPRIYTEAEFASLKQHYIVYRDNERWKFCFILASTNESALAKFAERFTTKPVKILNSEQFKTFWQTVQAEKHNIETRDFAFSAA